MKSGILRALSEANVQIYNGRGKPTPEYTAKALREIKDYQGVMGTLNPDENGWFDSHAALVIQTSEGRKEISLKEAVGMSKAFRR